MTYAIIGLLITLALGLPVAFAFGFGSIIAIWVMDLQKTMVTSVAFQSLDSFPLMAIPFFILAGDLMKEGGISDRLVNFAEAIMGKIRASMAYVMVLACVFFGAVSGSSVATVAAIGSVMLPKMDERGYNKALSVGLVSASGFLGILVPPSIPLVIYGVTGGVSVGELFLATVIPGIFLAVAYMVVIYYLARTGHFNNVKVEQGYTNKAEKFKYIRQTTFQGLPALFMPILILGGIYGGIFTPTEAACAAVIYSLIVGVFLYRGLKLKNVLSVFEGSMSITAVLMFLICFVCVMGRILMIESIPMRIAEFVMGISDNKILIMIFINIFLLVVGMFMETNTSILILAPILLPLMKQINVDPVHFGAILTLNLGIGLITPPFAANLFVGSKISGLPIPEILPYLMKFLFFAAIPVLILVTYIPQLSLWLPQFFLK